MQVHRVLLFSMIAYRAITMRSKQFLSWFAIEYIIIGK
jgi:hypothetical protein